MQKTPVWFLGWHSIGEGNRLPTQVFLHFPGGSAGKESGCNVGELGSIPRLGRSSGEENGYALQYSDLETMGSQRIGHDWTTFTFTFGLPQWLSGNECACNTGDAIQGSIPGWGRSPREGNGTLVQYSCLGNSMGGGIWQATVHRIARSRTQLKRLSTHK